jgi:5-formyltetrahydrofolate cyclo-ligase
MYVSAGAEVHTGECIRELLAQGKRVAIPYVKASGNDLGIASITDLSTDLEKGRFGVMEPIKTLRDNFFKSDLQVIVCPGAGFDTRGGRLGRGKACYDNFLKELHGKSYIIGLAFECQILKNSIPFEYHDIPVDQVITETGLLIGPMV